jgi:hypothetical protein
MVHEKADCSEIDADEGELVLVVEFDTMEHKAIAACDEDCGGLVYIISKTVRIVRDIVLEFCGVFFWAEEWEEHGIL